MHLAGYVDRPSTGAFAERFMSSASSVMPTADCFIYHVSGACLPLACRLPAASKLQLLAMLCCWSMSGATSISNSISFRRAAHRLHFCITSVWLADRCMRVFTYNPFSK
ncbi:hypothetical protein PQR53_36320 [Paraburkholderia fungorum]|uniref:hypothetical protein n=1 Tax=Paraburkholderia fungorum TaxID=134537 RepID=UPI0038B83E78